MTEDGARPLDTICLTCGAKVGFPCVTKSGSYAQSHAQRWRHVGVTGPTERDHARDYQDLLQRERERLEGFAQKERGP
jgi:hypothetical protein